MSHPPSLEELLTLESPEDCHPEATMRVSALDLRALLELARTSESWRLAELAWQQWATALCEHPEGGQLGDEVMREQIAQRLHNKR
jgi:hypothetical protein